jgi:hypothetical protein
MSVELRAFARALASMPRLSETDTAIALIWYLESSGAGEEHSVRSLAELMHDLSLRGAVNVARLKKRLGERRDMVVRGKAEGHVKLKTAAKAKLAEQFGDFTKPEPITVTDHILAASDFSAARGYLQSLVRQINGSYQSAFYDCCVVMMRRLSETLLIDAFEKVGHGDAIRPQGQYLQFGDMISIAQSGKYIHLQRGTPKVLEEVSVKGGTGAHDRYYITKIQDVDDLKGKYRKVIAELMHKAGF